MANKIKDFKGKRFGRLEVLEIVERGKAGKSVIWKCKCDCGAIIERSSNGLVTGKKYGAVQSCGCSQEYDLTDKVFGDLTAIRKIRKEKGLGVVWEFQCACGNLVHKTGSHVRRGDTKQHCGCKENRGGNNKNDLMGQRFGQVVVIGFAGTTKTCKSKWNCRCDCGVLFIMSGNNLRRLKNPNCGCNKTRSPALWKGKGTIPGSYYTKIKKGAAMRGLIFDITLDVMWSKLEKQNHKCALSGVQIEFGKMTSKIPTTASLDRIDSNRGYTVDNIQWVHKWINKMKMHLDESQFIEWCCKVAATHRSTQELR